MRRELWIGTSMVALSIGAFLCADEKKDDEAKEHANARIAVTKAKITMSKAVEITLQKVSNGKAVEAYLELEGDRVEFEVEILADNKHKEVKVDAVTGTAKIADDDGDDDDAEDTEETAATAATTLLQAIATAQAKVPNGKAFEAEPELEDGKLVYEVEFVDGDKIIEVEIDAATGKVLEVEEEK